jgi:hypothetical protein
MWSNGSYPSPGRIDERCCIFWIILHELEMAKKYIYNIYTYYVLPRTFLWEIFSASIVLVLVLPTLDRFREMQCNQHRPVRSPVHLETIN